MEAKAVKLRTQMNMDQAASTARYRMYSPDGPASFFNRSKSPRMKNSSPASPTKASVTALGRPPSTTLMLLPSPSPDTVNSSTASSSIQRGWRNSRLRNGSFLP